LYEAGRLRPAQLKGLAEVSASTHTGNALPVLRALAASAMQEGVGGRYDEPLRLIDLILLNAKGATATEAQQWLRGLARDHARKRNFIAGLTSRFHG
jgi:hypothetical protein